MAQARTTSLDVVGQKPLSRMVRLVCALMVLKRLHETDKASTVVAFKDFPSSKIVSSPPVVAVFVLSRRRRRIVIVTWTITSSPEDRIFV